MPLIQFAQSPQQKPGMVLEEIGVTSRRKSSEVIEKADRHLSEQNLWKKVVILTSSDVYQILEL